MVPYVDIIGLCHSVAIYEKSMYICDEASMTSEVE